MAKRSGYKFITYLDDNPLSPMYMETYVEKVEDTEKCPIEEDDLVLISNECELSNSGYTGYRISVYFNRTTGEYSEVKALDTECEPSSTEEQWIASGDPYCETTEKGVNTGYMVQVEVQMNPNLSNYGEKRYEKYKSPDCSANNCAIWDEVSHACHISVIDCVATFDGTADITEIDINPLSDTYNTTRTVNRVHNDCENCTNTLFEWRTVGTMCGDDEILCGNGIQQASTNSYLVSQKYKIIGSGTPIPMDEYQVVLYAENDENCGYIKPMYKMEKVGGYLCDYETYTKYERYARMVSYDSGVTWSVAQPLYTERGEVIAEESYDCGRPMYRWIDNGETTCVDNGDDGKIIYWDSEGVMVRIVPCDENAYVTSDMTWENVESGITSPDGYKNTYQIGDCAMELKDNAFKNTSFSDAALWLGDYTEKLGYNSLLSYSRGTLDIPSKISDFGAPFGNSRNYSIKALVMHPAEPPLLNDDIKLYFMTDRTAIFVPNENYDAYCNDVQWSAHTWSVSGRLLPMDNDEVEDYKAILRYKSDFTEWNYYVPSGETASAITTGDCFGVDAVTSITIGNGVETIEDSVFSSFRGTEITIPSNVKTIGQFAFGSGGYQDILTLTSITLNEGLETIANYAFNGNKAETIVIPDSVKTIGEMAFNQYNSCKAKHIVIGSGCTSIGGWAFQQYGSPWVRRKAALEDIYFRGLTPPTVGNKAFPDGDDPSYVKYTIYVPCGTIDAYKRALSVYASKSNITFEEYGCTIEWRTESSYCDVENGKMLETQRKYYVYDDGEEIETSTIREVHTTDCIEVVNGVYYQGYGYSPFTHDTSESAETNTFKASGGGSGDVKGMSFKYLNSGGFSVTISKTQSESSQNSYIRVEDFDTHTTIGEISGSETMDSMVLNLQSNKNYAVFCWNGSGTGTIIFHI